MKYLVHELGVDRFRQLVESYTGKEVQPWRSMPDWKYSDWLGWHEQGDGKWFLGVSEGDNKTTKKTCLVVVLIRQGGGGTSRGEGRGGEGGVPALHCMYMSYESRIVEYMLFSVVLLFVCRRRCCRSLAGVVF